MQSHLEQQSMLRISVGALGRVRAHPSEDFEVGGRGEGVRET